MQLITRIELLAALHRVGLLADPRAEISNNRLSEIIQHFQRIHGISPDDGIADQRTVRTLLRWRFCSVPDRLAVDKKSMCRWDHTTWDGTGWNGEPENTTLQYHVSDVIPGLTRAETNMAFAEALQYWTDVCAVNFVLTSDASKANLFYEVRAIDDASGTLAWQELPCGKDTRATMLTGRYDADEPWVVSINPPPQKIDVVRVICHETGHGIGLDHGPEGNLLAPYYDRNIRKPQAWDIQQAVTRYGPPVTGTEPTPPDPGPGPPVFPQFANVRVEVPPYAMYSGQIPKIST